MSSVGLSFLIFITDRNNKITIMHTGIHIGMPAVRRLGDVSVFKD